MPTFDLSDAVRLAEAQAAFADDMLAGELQSTAPDVAVSLSAAALYRYARRGIEPDDLWLERLLRDDAAARGLYRRFVSAAATLSLPQAMAASSEEIPSRDVPGCRISATRSQAEPEQFIVVIELRESSGAGPATLVLCDGEQRCRHFALPAARRDIIQLIEQADSDLIGLLADPRTEAFLL